MAIRLAPSAWRACPMAWAEVRDGTPVPAVISEVVVASYAASDRLADVCTRHTISTFAVPSSRAWYAISSGRLGEKGVLSPLPRRPTCTWSVGGSSRLYSISTVVLVEGIRTPKWRIIARPPGNREGNTYRVGRVTLGRACGGTPALSEGFN